MVPMQDTVQSGRRSPDEAGQVRGTRRHLGRSGGAAPAAQLGNGPDVRLLRPRRPRHERDRAELAAGPVSSQAICGR